MRQRIELARAVVEKIYKKKKLPEPGITEELSPEYWAGWALAEFQWYSGKRFKDIFDRVKLSEIITMYPAYHEMDITAFLEMMEERCGDPHPPAAFTPYRGKIRKSGTGGINAINDHLYEGHCTPTNAQGKREVHTVYAKTREEVEPLLEQMIAEVRERVRGCSGIDKEKRKRNNRRNNTGAERTIQTPKEQSEEQYKCQRNSIKVVLFPWHCSELPR